MTIKMYYYSYFEYYIFISPVLNILFSPSRTTSSSTTYCLRLKSTDHSTLSWKSTKILKVEASWLDKHCHNKTYRTIKKSGKYHVFFNASHFENETFLLYYKTINIKPLNMYDPRRYWLKIDIWIVFSSDNHINSDGKQVSMKSKHLFAFQFAVQILHQTQRFEADTQHKPLSDIQSPLWVTDIKSLHFYSFIVLRSSCQFMVVQTGTKRLYQQHV